MWKTLKVIHMSMLIGLCATLKHITVIFIAQPKNIEVVQACGILREGKKGTLMTAQYIECDGETNEGHTNTHLPSCSP